MTTKRYGWCGTANSLDTECCIACQAAFPHPELDEALRWSSDERVWAALLK